MGTLSPTLRVSDLTAAPLLLSDMRISVGESRQIIGILAVMSPDFA